MNATAQAPLLDTSKAADSSIAGLSETIPTLDDRKGEFSRLLGVNAGWLISVSVRPDPDRFIQVQGQLRF